jgi:hypothetical protein
MRVSTCVLRCSQMLPNLLFSAVIQLTVLRCCPTYCSQLSSNLLFSDAAQLTVLSCYPTYCAQLTVPNVHFVHAVVLAPQEQQPQFDAPRGVPLPLMSLIRPFAATFGGLPSFRMAPRMMSIESSNGEEKQEQEQGPMSQLQQGAGDNSLLLKYYRVCHLLLKVLNSVGTKRHWLPRRG